MHQTSVVKVFEPRAYRKIINRELQRPSLIRTFAEMLPNEFGEFLCGVGHLAEASVTGVSRRQFTGCSEHRKRSSE